MSFWLDDNSDSKLRLKKFSSASTGNKSTITIVLETSDPYHLAHALERLSAVQKGQNAKPEAAPKTQQKKRPLALPAPPLALPLE